MKISKFMALLSWMGDHADNIHFRDVMEGDLSASHDVIFLPVTSKTMWATELQDLGAYWDEDACCWAVRT